MFLLKFMTSQENESAKYQYRTLEGRNNKASSGIKSEAKMKANLKIDVE